MKYAIISTEKGDMKAELYTNETPIAAENFIKLAQSRFYDGLTFHRVIPNFVIQGGCPIGNGAGGPGYTIKCETSAERQYHERGVMSMAHRGKDTGGSQFFICHEDSDFLDGDYAGSRMEITCGRRDCKATCAVCGFVNMSCIVTARYVCFQLPVNVFFVCGICDLLNEFRIINSSVVCKGD